MTSAKFVRPTQLTFLYASTKTNTWYTVKIIITNRDSSREELNRSEAFDQNNATPTVG